MEIKNAIAVLMVSSMIIAVSSLVATIFALPFIIFIAIFVLAFARTSKHDINRIRAGLGLNEDMAVLLISVIPLLTYLLLSGLGMAVMLPNEHTINPFIIELGKQGNTLKIHETMTYRLTGEELATELSRYLPADANVSNIGCPEGLVPFNYSIGNNLKVGCKSVSGHLTGGEHTMQIWYTLPMPPNGGNNKVSLGKLELNAPMAVIKARGINASLETEYISQGESIIVDLGKNTQTSLFANVKQHVFLTGLAVVLGAIAALIVTYLLLGKEKSFADVPHYLAKIPSHRKPYEVNLAFYGDPDKIEDGAVLATILDLARRGYLKVKSGRIEFTSKKPSALDEYEGKVVWLGYYQYWHLTSTH